MIFCFPFRGAGGVPLLFIRLGNHLKDLGYNIAIIDYIDGYMSINNKSNLELIEYKDDEKISVRDGSVLIMQSLGPWSIYPSLSIDKNVKLFFITTIPANFYLALPIIRDYILRDGLVAKFIWHTVLRSEFKKILKFIDLSQKKDSIVFLDEDIVCNIQNSLNINISLPKILPMFSEQATENKYLNTKSGDTDELVAGWVGRIADFKVHILNKVIEDLKNYSDKNKLKIKFIIIGTGDKENILSCSNSDNFSIQRIDHIEPSKLQKQLLMLDIYFAMGTSALDGAMHGVPTVRLDYSFAKITQIYKYKFLFDTVGYSLGENIDSKCYNIGLHTIDEVIWKITNQKNKISAMIYEFYIKNHSISRSAMKFVEFVADTKLIYGDLNKDNLLTSKIYSLWRKIEQ